MKPIMISILIIVLSQTVMSLDINNRIVIDSVSSYQDTIVVTRTYLPQTPFHILRTFIDSLPVHINPVRNQTMLRNISFQVNHNQTIFKNISFQVNHSQPLVNITNRTPIVIISPPNITNTTPVVVIPPTNTTNKTPTVIIQPNVTTNATKTLVCNQTRVISQEYEPIVETYARLDNITGITKRMIGRTTLGKPIYLYELGHGPKFAFDGRIHGVEDCGTQNGVLFMEWAEGKDLGVKLQFIPGINLDNKVGRINANQVDLNRNFPIGWRQTLNDGYAYSGPYAASEVETQAMINFFEDERPVVFMDIHCGQTLMRYKQSNTLALSITNHIKQLNMTTYNKYTPRQIGTTTPGYIIADAQNYVNVSILLESSVWDELPSSKACYEATLWREQEAIYRGIVEAIR